MPKIVAELYLGPAYGWVDITDDVRVPTASSGGGISITRGQQAEGQRTEPARGSLVLNNRHGKYSPRNPRSEYYGLIGRNTPIRVGVDHGDSVDWRMTGEVSSWPTRWDLSGNDVWVPIEVAGILRRLGQGAKPLRSALTRYLADTGPVAWWPLEDGADSTRAAPGLPSGQPAVVLADIMDFVDDAPPGASGSAYPRLDAVNALVGEVSGASASAWQVAVWARGVPQDLTESGDAAFFVPLEVYTSQGRVFRWIFQYNHSMSLRPDIGIAYYPSSEAADTDIYLQWDDPGPGPLYGPGEDWRLVQFTCQQLAGDLSVALYVDGVLAQSATWAGITAGAPVRVHAPGAFAGTATEVSSKMQDFWISQIVVHNGSALVPMWEPGQGWDGEDATERMIRLCAEQGVPLMVLDGSEFSATPMGPQRADTFLALIGECADADMGLLYEQRDELGLAYRTRTSLENQLPLELDYARHIAPPVEPVDDDESVRNDIEVSRVDGSSARAVLEAGPLSTLPPPAGVGVYDESVTINVASDEQLPDQAGWRLHLGTWDAARYPRLTVRLIAPRWRDEPALAAEVAAVDSGDRVAVDGLPDWLPPGPVDVLVRGYTETLDATEWSITWVATPAGPWDIATADGEQRAPADGSTLAAELAVDATTLLIASTAANGVWTTDPADMPLALRVGADQVLVSAISGSSSPQTATIAPSSPARNRAWPAGTEVDVWAPAIAPL